MFNSIVYINNSALVVYECSADMLEADAGSNKIVNILVAKGSPIPVHFGILGAKVSLDVVQIKALILIIYLLNSFSRLVQLLNVNSEYFIIIQLRVRL